MVRFGRRLEPRRDAPTNRERPIVEIHVRPPQPAHLASPEACESRNLKGQARCRRRSSQDGVEVDPMHCFDGLSAAFRQSRKRRHRCQQSRVHRRSQYRPHHDVKPGPRARRQALVDQLSIQQCDRLPVDRTERHCPKAWPEQRVELHVVPDARRWLQRALHARAAKILHGVRERDRLRLHRALGCLDDVHQGTRPRELILQAPVLSLRGFFQLHLRVTPIAMDLAVRRSVRDVNDPAALTAPSHNANSHVRGFPVVAVARVGMQKVSRRRAASRSFSDLPGFAERNAPAVREFARSHAVDECLVDSIAGGLGASFEELAQGAGREPGFAQPHAARTSARRSYDCSCACLLRRRETLHATNVFGQVRAALTLACDLLALAHEASGRLGVSMPVECLVDLRVQFGRHL